MLIAPVPDRIDGRRSFGKLRATAKPEAQRKVKHHLAAVAAQIGVPSKLVYGSLGRGILP